MSSSGRSKFEGVDGTSLAGQIAVVTGAARPNGIGYAIAHGLALAGADVAVSYRSSRLDAESTVSDLRSLGVEAVAIEADLATRTGCQGLIAQACEALGPVDILVNNAATQHIVPLLQLSGEQWDSDLGLCLSAVFHCSQAVARSMVEDGRNGAIIAISSSSAVLPDERLAHQAAAKAGVNAFVRAAANELGRYGIRVNAVAPGPAGPTDLNRDLMPSTDAVRSTEAQIPLGRLARPFDVASAVAWLCSPSAAYITGAILPVDGGYTVAKSQVEGPTTSARVGHSK